MDQILETICDGIGGATSSDERRHTTQIAQVTGQHVMPLRSRISQGRLRR